MIMGFRFIQNATGRIPNTLIPTSERKWFVVANLYPGMAPVEMMLWQESPPPQFQS